LLRYNFTLRTEYFDDMEGQRTGVIRPEIGYYRSINANAFNGDANAGIPPSRNWAVIAASDLILHF
jgi:hypothetical protein